MVCFLAKENESMRKELLLLRKEMEMNDKGSCYICSTHFIDLCNLYILWMAHSIESVPIYRMARILLINRLRNADCVIIIVS